MQWSCMSVTRDLSHWGGDAWRGFTQATASQTACRMLSAGCSNGLQSRRRLFEYGNASGWGGIQAWSRSSQAALVFQAKGKNPT